MESSSPIKKRKVIVLSSHDDEEEEQDQNSLLLADILSPGTFTISIKPLLLDEWKVDTPLDAGCVIRIHRTDPVDLQLVMEDVVHAGINSTISNASLEKVSDVVKHLIQNQTESYEDVLAVADRLAESPELMIGRDEVEWFSDTSLLKFSLLRRLAVPMYIVYENKPNQLMQSGASLVESIFLKSVVLRNTVGNAIYARIKEIEATIKAITTQKGNPSVSEKRSVKLLKDLHQRLVAIMERTNSAKFDSRIKIDPCTMTRKQGPASYFIPSENALEQTLAVRSERQRIMQDLQRRIKTQTKETPLLALGGQVEFPKGIYNGNLLLTSKELSDAEFSQQRDIMEQVNKTIRRPYKPGYSVPRFQQAKISDKALKQLKAVFFDEDGSLNKKILKDTDFTARNGFLNFANDLCKKKRTDKRWQIPLRRHSPQKRSVGTRARIEDLMSDQQLVNLEVETIHDLGMLIGGTQDQSLHHDIPRQAITWLTQDPKISRNGNLPFTGWEFDRAAYNEAMASPNAPRSILLAMNDSKIARIGVQKNQVAQIGDEYCRIVNGLPDQKFRIIRETEFLVVLEASPGVVFTGDFPHAGVRNVQIASEEDELMRDLFDEVEEIINTSKNAKYSDIIKNVFKMMCNSPNLDKICRFHCSTEPIGGQLEIPRNTIGFVDCYPNRPDKRFDDKIYRCSDYDGAL